MESERGARLVYGALFGWWLGDLPAPQVQKPLPPPETWSWSGTQKTIWYLMKRIKMPDGWRFADFGDTNDSVRRSEFSDSVLVAVERIHTGEVMMFEYDLMRLRFNSRAWFDGFHKALFAALEAKDTKEGY